MQVMTLGVMADPGQPQKIARSAEARLRQELAKDSESTGIVWSVEIAEETLPLTTEGEIPLVAKAERIRQQHHWDYVVYLTDLPRSHEGDPMLCELAPDARGALVSLPALGLDPSGTKAWKLISALLRSIRDGVDATPEGTVGKATGIRQARWVDVAEEGVSYVVLPGHTSRLRLLAGMVLSNRPGKLLPALASSVAAAMATGAFGIFYASIWTLSDALSYARLALISTLVISALAAWLIFHNQLWNRRDGSDEGWRVRLDNASTVITVGLSVLMMYLLLWTGLFLIGLAVIEAAFLEEQLEHPIGLLDYVGLSWLAASLGTMAGALGSNFDGDDAIREATYSKREHQRRQLRDSYED